MAMLTEHFTGGQILFDRRFRRSAFIATKSRRDRHGNLIDEMSIVVMKRSNVVSDQYATTFLDHLASFRQFRCSGAVRNGFAFSFSSLHSPASFSLRGSPDGAMVAPCPGDHRAIREGVPGASTTLSFRLRRFEESSIFLNYLASFRQFDVAAMFRNGFAFANLDIRSDTCRGPSRSAQDTSRRCQEVGLFSHFSCSPS